MRQFVDLKESGTEVIDGATSISEGKVVTRCLMFGKETVYDISYSPKAKAILGLIQTYPFCVKHGVLVKVGPTGIWRCLECHEGAWELPE